MTRQERRERRLLKAAERRESTIHIDPATGKATTGHALGTALAARRDQTVKITKKRTQRRTFKAKSRWQQETASFAGLAKQGLPEDRAARLHHLREQDKGDASAGLNQPTHRRP